MKQKLNVGKIVKVPIRQAFAHEAHDFTVWLAENVDALSDQIGLPLIVEQREMRVGRFSADLVCLDTSGNRIVIENQLESTDHDHLGKIVTYMGNLQANTAIWITPEPRIEHQTAIEYLNSQYHQSGLRIYLVLLEAIRVDSSRIAPLFTILVRPQDDAAAVSETGLDNYTNLETDSTESERNTELPATWCVYPVRDEATYKLFLDENLVGLGFGNLGDLSKLPANPQAFRDEWIKRNPSQSASQARAFYPMFYSFRHRVKKHDLVIYPPTWREQLIHVGEIAGDYMYRGGLFRNYRDVRPVSWIAAIPRENFSSTARKGISVTLAFFQIRNEDFLNELEANLHRN